MVQLTAGLLLYTALWQVTALHVVSPVPMAQRHCTPSDNIKVTPGSSLTIECGSHCPTFADSEEKTSVEHSLKGFSWSKYMELPGSATQLPDTLQPLMRIESVTHQHGGHYVCKCLPNGPECMYNVSVMPEMIFKPSRLAVHYGENFDLTCTMRAFPTNFTTIMTSHGVELSDQIRGRLDAFTTRSFVPIVNSEETEFVCFSETYLLGSLMARLEKHISLVVYTPPLIIFTTEFVIQSQDYFGKPGQLMCTVQTSPDASISVAWWVNGSKIETDRASKYHTEVVRLNADDVMQYRLIIDDLQHSDIGSYLCQLSTQYRVEDSQEAWLQVDFRKGTDVWGKTHNRGEYQPNQWSHSRGSSADSRSDILFFGVISLTMIGFMLALWRLVVNKKGQKERKAMPIVSYSDIPEAFQGSTRSPGDHTHSLRYQAVSFRRK